MLNLAPHSKLWIFQADRFLSEIEVEAIKKEINLFMEIWASHGNELYGDSSVESNLFLIIGADESKSPTSGCSIDSLTRKVKEIGENLNIDFFNRLKIAYEDSTTQIHLTSMGDFKKLMSSDDVTGQTVVYNNLIETVADLDDNWRTIVSKSWHKNILQVI